MGSDMEHVTITIVGGDQEARHAMAWQIKRRLGELNNRVVFYACMRRGERAQEVGLPKPAMAFRRGREVMLIDAGDVAEPVRCRGVGGWVRALLAKIRRSK